MTNTVMALGAEDFRELEMVVEDGATIVANATELDRSTIEGPLPTIYFAGIPYVKRPKAPDA